MVHRLVRTAEETVFQPENLGAPIQVVGLVEAAGSEFDHLWITGMHAAAWPPDANPSPFIPIDLQRLHNVRGASSTERLDYARQTTDRLLRSACDLIVSYPMREQDVELTPSPLISGFREITRAAILQEPVTRYERALFAAAAAITASDDRGPVVVEPISSGGTNIFKLQAACPFHAFAELRLGARELHMPAPGLNYKVRGILLHRSLELIWEGLRSQKELNGKSQVELEELVRDGINRSLEESEAALLTDWERQVVQIERERLARLVLALLEQEKQRPTPFRVVEHEHKEQITHGGVTATVQVDRIDELDGGGLVLLDYKSGKPKVSHWEGDRPEDPQVPIYATYLGSRLRAAAFVQLNQEEIGFKGYAKKIGILPSSVRSFDWMSEKQRPAPTFEDMLRNWSDTLERLGRNFREGRSEVDPKNKKRTCERCNLGMLCRVNEAPFEPDEEGDDTR
jgi:probable DNA repair protein